MSELASMQRHTRQRAAVARVMADGEQFRSAQQVHDTLRAEGASVGLTTVYRTLQSMADAGELDVLRTPDGEVAYRRCGADGHHHHLVCRNCGKVVEIMGDDAVNRFVAAAANDNGFRDIDHELEFFGLCADCPNPAAGS